MHGSWLASNGKWLAGYVGLWLALTAMVDMGAGDIAAALGITITSSFVLINGKGIFDNINKLVA